MSINKKLLKGWKLTPPPPHQHHSLLSKSTMYITVFFMTPTNPFIRMGEAGVPDAQEAAQVSLKSLTDTVLFSLENPHYRARVTVIRLGGKGE